MLRTVLMMLLIGLSSCVSITRRTDILGLYELHFSAGTISLRLNSDGSCVETIHYSDGQKQQATGTWSQDRENLHFEKMLVPNALKTTLFSPGAEDSRWSRSHESDVRAGAIWQYGKTILEIQPDVDENFVRVSDR
jgi:hypothetical protein